MTQNLKLIVVAGVMAVVGMPAAAQTPLPAVVTLDPESDVSIRSDPSADAGSQSISGGNVFDFSGGTNNPPPPGLPSFAGGPCTGSSGGASASIGGVAIGAGRSSVDESCQRRNWVQTLIGASQHMPPAEAQLLLRTSIELMRDDPHLAEPLRRAGLPDPVTNRDNETMSTRGRPGSADDAYACNVMVSGNAPVQLVQVLEERGCNVDN